MQIKISTGSNRLQTNAAIRWIAKEYGLGRITIEEEKIDGYLDKLVIVIETFYPNANYRKTLQKVIQQECDVFCSAWAAGFNDGKCEALMDYPF